MVTFLIILFIIVILISVHVAESVHFDVIGFLLALVSIIVIIILAFMEVYCVGSLFDSIKAEEKIAMYQEENSKIESQINELVEKYMDYESETLSEFKSESSITLVSLYPELKSDTLVQTQITTYTENNNIIKELKEMLIDRSVYRWMLYFGK